MSVVAVIPARAGSKGIVGKNLRALAGRPLIAHTIEAARRAACVDRVIVSTDGEDIAQVARDYGAEVPFMRPGALATDDATTVDVVRHVVDALAEREGERQHTVIVLQPTSPLRTADDIDAAHARFVDRDARACVSVCAVDKHPAWMVRVDENGSVRFFLDDAARATRRQALAPLYVLNGALYLIGATTLESERSFIPEGTIAYVMDKARSVDVDDEVDLALCETLLSREGAR